MLKGRIALITGASRGIGRAIAIELASQGANVALHYHQNRSAAEETFALLKGRGHLMVQADLFSASGVARLAGEAMKHFGHIDILVNNAGVYIEKPMLTMNFEEWKKSWDQTIALNLDAPAHLSYHVARRMIADGGGRIINITSRGAFRGEPDAPAYGASKAGLNSFSQSLAKALAPGNVLVFAVAPGFVETDMAQQALQGPRGEEIRAQSPLNRTASPAEIANLVAYLAGDAPAYLTGSIIDINGASYLRN
ncbi:MAG: SDR family oxidoreductase [Bacteroidales bacterium]|nr:SDR family oxidoreductase [Bacteroidales bacterium]MDZ4205438.1 SDR family oxidoreductase [Bacteroidales bacterium]